MSAINGDKARFHKARKEKIARRARNHARWAAESKAAPVQPKSAKVTQ
jgi:hypothetical protein